MLLQTKQTCPDNVFNSVPKFFTCCIHSVLFEPKIKQPYTHKSKFISRNFHIYHIQVIKLQVTRMGFSAMLYLFCGNVSVIWT